MDKRHDPKQLFKLTESNSHTRTILSTSSDSSKSKTKNSNTTDAGTNKLDTSPLDHAMQELLDICKQYNDKLAVTTNLDKNGDMMGSIFKDQDSSLTKIHANASANANTNANINDNSRLFKTTECDNENKKSNSSTSTNLLDQQQAGTTTNSIENLQQKQCEIQAQLDEVLQVSKKLEFKQRKKMDCILEDFDSRNKTSDSGNDEEGEDDEDELVEFQQIENELRISELNRQLNNIQEELRLRLFKRLLSNTHHSSFASKVDQENRNKPGHHAEQQASPSSSSCSNDPSLSTNTSGNLNQQGPPVDVVDGSNLDKIKSTNTSYKPRKKNRSSNESTDTQAESRDFLSRGSIKRFSPASNSSSTTNTPTNVQSDQDSMVDNVPDYEALTPTTSRESLGSSSKRSPPIEPTSGYNNISSTSSSSTNYAAMINGTCHPNTFRNNSANSDLERIEEDEEDSQDYYNNSDHFRSVYEEKISPIYNMENSIANGNYATPRHSNLRAFNQQNQMASTAAYNVYLYEERPKQEKQHISCSEAPRNDNIRSYCEGEKSSFRKIYGNVDRVNMSVPKATHSNNMGASNRPLTLYLPRPDEEIDLVEHIQALGHDIDIISDELMLNSSSAQGYLWKSCSNNNKKWLRRYFYFDRNSKLLLYYDRKSQINKKHNSPKNMIQFDEISDVYVDHKLSGIGEKDRSSKRKNYVFVLATINRKYQLASSRAEVMRVWIDILFTAAKADDVFQHLTDIGDETQEKICL